MIGYEVFISVMLLLNSVNFERKFLIFLQCGKSYVDSSCQSRCANLDAIDLARLICWWRTVIRGGLQHAALLRLRWEE